MWWRPAGCNAIQYVVRFRAELVACTQQENATRSAPGNEKFFACPAKCGKYLMDQDPQYEMIPRGKTQEEGFKKVLQLGKCSCGAAVCVRCHELGIENANGEIEHTCPAALDREIETDAATLKLLKKLGKKCPNCSMFMQKNDGCVSPLWCSLFCILHSCVHTVL